MYLFLSLWIRQRPLKKKEFFRETHYLTKWLVIADGELAFQKLVCSVSVYKSALTWNNLLQKYFQTLSMFSVLFDQWVQIEKPNTTHLNRKTINFRFLLQDKMEIAKYKNSYDTILLIKSLNSFYLLVLPWWGLNGSWALVRLYLCCTSG